ncbi:MAG: hypothetical protein ACPG42_00255 [Alphaproteobacteria bacterium]
MKLLGALIAFAAVLLSAPVQAQTLNYSISPETIKTYAKVSLNTTFQLNLKENEMGLVSNAEVDPGMGLSLAAGLEVLPEFDVELELSGYTGSVDYRTIAGAPVIYAPAEEIRLLSGFVNGYFKFNSATNARFKLGGGLGYSNYTLTDSTNIKHRGNGLAYQVKGVGEYDFGPNATFVSELGYIATTDIDVELSNALAVRDTAVGGITFGVGTKFRF